MTKHRKDRADMIVTTIADFRLEYGYGPTVRELRDRVGLASTSAVHHHLLKLADEGRISYDPKHARTLAVTSTVVPFESGICARPGCGKATRRPTRGPESRWCSRTCAAVAAHVRRWLRATDTEYLAERIGLPL